MMQIVSSDDHLPPDLGDTIYVIVRERLANPDDPWIPESPKIWTALTALDRSTDDEAIVVFRSPPSAIGFMKPALTHGFLSEGGKIAKYSRAVVETWGYPLLIEPSADDLPVLRRHYEFPGPGIDLD